MGYRGFDNYLTSRVDRAEGDRFYFREDTLKFFDAYGGAMGCLPSDLDGQSGERRLQTVVESVKGPSGIRTYRFVAVLFTDQGPARTERVTILRPMADEDDIRTAATAERRMRVWLRNVAEIMTATTGHAPRTLDYAVEHAPTTAS